MKEEEDPAKEAFNAAAFAQLVSCPGGWQARAVLLAFGIARDDGDGTQGRVDPGDEAQAPIACIQTDDTRTDVIETNGPLQQRAGKGSVVDIGWRDEKMDGQARATTEQGVHTTAA